MGGSGFRLRIVGGVAGGMSAAARARRLSEDAAITVYERGPHVSFANCGLPYHVGGEIREAAALVVQTPEAVHQRFRIEVRTGHEVLSVDRERRLLRVRDERSGQEFEDGYDALILATGATALRPPIPGLGGPGQFHLRTIPEMEALEAWLARTSARRAVVVGGGFIGLETAEQLHRRGLEVAIVEAARQLLPPADPEVAEVLARHLVHHGLQVRTGGAVAGFDPPSPDAAAGHVRLAGGDRLPADVVVLAMGVRPRVELARAAGLELGSRGGVRVDEGLRTSDPRIFAVGDAIETRDPVTGTWRLAPLAGPANRQGRIAAENALGGEARYRGTWGTAIVRVMDLTVGVTGANARDLAAAGISFRTVRVHRDNHASYYPGASTVSLLLHFGPDDGRVLGGQALGHDGIDKRTDVIATALQAGMTVEDLAELELAYSPPFGSAKDPVNVLGMAASNLRRGLLRTADAEVLESAGRAGTLIDVRSPREFAQGALDGARNIPLPELRDRLGEIPGKAPVAVVCRSGQRSYYAQRILSQTGRDCVSLDGGMLSRDPDLLSVPPRPPTPGAGSGTSPGPGTPTRKP